MHSIGAASISQVQINRTILSTTLSEKSSRNNSITIISDHMQQKTCNPTIEIPDDFVINSMWSILDITCDQALTICLEKYQNYNYIQEFEVARIFCSCYQGFHWRLPSFHYLKDDIVCPLMKTEINKFDAHF